MSNLGGLGTVPALLALACILAAVAVVAGLCCWAIVRNFELSVVGPLLGFFALVSLVAAITLAITAGGIVQKHRNDTCHRMGGILAYSSAYDCIKPGSPIDVR